MGDINSFSVQIESSSNPLEVDEVVDFDAGVILLWLLFDVATVPVMVRGVLALVDGIAILGCCFGATALAFVLTFAIGGVASTVFVGSFAVAFVFAFDVDFAFDVAFVVVFAFTLVFIATTLSFCIGFSASSSLSSSSSE